MGGYSNIKRYEIGPFLRYYWLTTGNQINLLTQVSYQYGLYYFKPTKGNINTFSFNAGPVIYLNSSVGLEFTIGYFSRIEDIKEESKETRKGLQAGIGLQIHLEKE